MTMREFIEMKHHCVLSTRQLHHHHILIRLTSAFCTLGVYANVVLPPLWHRLPPYYHRQSLSPKNSNNFCETLRGLLEKGEKWWQMLLAPQELAFWLIMWVRLFVTIAYSVSFVTLFCLASGLSVVCVWLRENVEEGGIVEWLFAFAELSFLRAKSLFSVGLDVGYWLKWLEHCFWYCLWSRISLWLGSLSLWLFVVQSFSCSCGLVWTEIFFFFGYDDVGLDPPLLLSSLLRLFPVLSLSCSTKRCCCCSKLYSKLSIVISCLASLQNNSFCLRGNTK